MGFLSVIWSVVNYIFHFDDRIRRFSVNNILMSIRKGVVILEVSLFSSRYILYIRTYKSIQKMLCCFSDWLSSSLSPVINVNVYRIVWCGRIFSGQWFWVHKNGRKVLENIKKILSPISPVGVRFTSNLSMKEWKLFPSHKLPRFPFSG